MGYRIMVAAAALAGCGGATRGPESPGGPRGVEAAALPYRILAARGGGEVVEDALVAALGQARAVCIGEHHPNPHDHWAQLHLLGRILDRHRADGRTTALGMEMFQRPFQGVLDDFAAGRIDEAALRSRSGWKDRWGYDYALYRPMIALAVSRGAALLALNTARELTKKVSRKGLASLTAAERADLPELVLDDPDHRAWWDAIMSDMGGADGHATADEHDAGDAPAGATGDPPAAPTTAAPTPTHAPTHAPTPAAPTPTPAAPTPTPTPAPAPAHDADVGEAPAMPDPERVYTAQVLWDETMADTAARWLAGGADRRVVILAGAGHCHESAVVRRLERRGVGEVVSVRPLIDRGDGEVARLVARPENDFLFVMSRE